MRDARALWAEAAGTTIDEATAVALVATVRNQGIRDRVMADLIDLSDEPEAFKQTLTGQTTTAPDWARLEAAGQLTDLLAATPTDYRAPLFAMQGWLSWYKGRSTVAAAYMGKASAADPGLELANLLDELFELGILPETSQERGHGLPAKLTRILRGETPAQPGPFPAYARRAAALPLHTEEE